MKISIKEKIKEGKKVQGAINDNLKVIIPFEFERIEECTIKDYYSYTFYKCIKEDGTTSVYDSEGNLLLSHTDGYTVIDFLPMFSGRAFSVMKDDKKGVIKSKLLYEGKKSEVSGYELETLYKLSDDIDFVVEGKNVKVVKHLKTKDKIGYLYHSRFEDFKKPMYSSINYHKLNAKRVEFYKLSDGHSRGNPSFERSEDIQYDKFTFNAELVKYSVATKDGEKFGLKHKVLDSEKSSYHYYFKLDDFLPCDYSKITYDDELQMYYLEKVVNGKVKKGLVGIAFDWNFFSKGWWIWGYPSLLKTIELDCIYDDYEIIDGKYILVTKDGKKGVFKYSFNKSNGDYFNNNRVSACPRLHEVASPIYDSIEKVDNTFICTANGEKVIISDSIEINSNNVFSKVSNSYKDVKKLSLDMFLAKKDNKNDLVYINRFWRASWDTHLSSSISIIENIDDAYVISTKYNPFIVVVNGDKKDLYKIDDKKLSLIEEDIKDASYSLDEEILKVEKNNGHISYYSSSGTLYFSSEELELDIENSSITYNHDLDLFKVLNNGKISLYAGKRINLGQKAYEGREFVDFNTCLTSSKRFVGYREVIDNFVHLPRLVTVDVHKNCAETLLFEGEYYVNNIVCGGTRIIVTKVFEDGTEKVGVIESTEGNICIDYEYDSIDYDAKHNIFICNYNEDKFYFDKDGFSTDEPSYVSTSNSKLTLK